MALHFYIIKKQNPDNSRLKGKKMPGEFLKSYKKENPFE
jgi:hypothetical protein